MFEAPEFDFDGPVGARFAHLKLRCELFTQHRVSALEVIVE